MAAGKIEIIGKEKLFYQLQALGDRCSAVLESAVTEGGRVVADEAGPNAPKLTGVLGESIEVETTQSSRTIASVVVGFLKRAFYGKFQELGTSKMAANPFLRPAFDSKREAVKRKIAEELKRAVLRRL